MNLENAALALAEKNGKFALTLKTVTDINPNRWLYLFVAPGESWPGLDLTFWGGVIGGMLGKIILKKFSEGALPGALIGLFGDAAEAMTDSNFDLLDSLL